MAPPARAATRRPKDEVGHLIQGRPASAPEWAVYQVLRELGWKSEIGFQVEILGGRRLGGGGQVLDFVIMAGPTTTVIDVRGEHWHGPAAGKTALDRFREMQLAALPDPPRLIIVWENVAYAKERLRALLLKELGAKR